jgi:hypothetical protein
VNESAAIKMVIVDDDAARFIDHVTDLTPERVAEIHVRHLATCAEYRALERAGRSSLRCQTMVAEAVLVVTEMEPGVFVITGHDLRGMA